jgi:hypothetical protein
VALNTITLTLTKTAKLKIKYTCMLGLKRKIPRDVKVEGIPILYATVAV